MNLADNLKKLRKEHNLSQEALADKLNVSRQSVSKWESNQAYPEMDKVLQICELFNLTLDELMHQDVKEINNTKQGKNNINKFIDDFLMYLTKTIDLFGSLKFKEKIKCIFEEAVILVVLNILLYIFGKAISGVLYGLLSPFHFTVYRPIYLISSGIYTFACVTISIIVLFYTFKTRYLDYFEIVKETPPIKEEVKEESQKMPSEKDSSNNTNTNTIYKGTTKVIIRDPEHTGYKFINGLLKFFIGVVKAFAIFLAAFLCFTLISMVIFLILSLLVIKTTLTFLGLFVSIASCLAVNIVLLLIIFNFVTNHKINTTLYGKIFLVSLLSFGVGTGLVFVDLPNYKMVNSIENSDYITEEKTIPMQEDLVLDHRYINYLEASTDNDLRIVISHSKVYDTKIDIIDNYLYINVQGKDNQFQAINTIIKDINNKKIVDYSNQEIKIYTTAENIAKLKANYGKILEDERNLYYENLLSDYKLTIKEKDERIAELEEALDSCNLEE